MTKRVPHLAQVSDFDIKLLKVFIQVVDAGGFSSAEPVLGISRSAISQYMSDLEQRLGLRLCQRGRAGFTLTNDGQEVYNATLKLLASVDQFRSEVNNLHQELRGSLVIGLPDNLVSSPHMKITHALSHLKQLGEQVEIHIRMVTPDVIEQGVLDGRFHVGVVPENQGLSGLDYRFLYQERSLLYCAASHPLFDHTDNIINDTLLKEYPAIAPTFRLPATIQQRYHDLNCQASASDREGMAFLILTGQYISYLPDHFAQRWVEHGQLRAIRPEHYFYDLNLALITRKGRRPNTVLERFLDQLPAPH